MLRRPSTVISLPCPTQYQPQRMGNMYTLDQLFQMEEIQRKKEQGKDPDPAVWRWSPFDIRVFDEMLQKACDLAVREQAAREEYGTLSYVEAGSGIGTKVYWAEHEYHLIATGYEINDEYLAMSRQLGVTVIPMDLSDLDNQPVWQAYQIVYSARMFKDDVFQAKWEQNLQHALYPGTVLMMTYAASKPYDWPCYLRAPWRGVWVKPLPGKAYTPSTERLISL